MIRKRGLYLWTAVLLGICLFLVGAARFTLTWTAPPPVKATWIWDIHQVSDNRDQVIRFARQRGVNLIYLHIDQKDLSNFSLDPYRSFIKEAAAAGIHVDALGGDPKWALISYRNSLTQLVSWVKNYNLAVDENERFHGIHVDIEPYLLPEWKQNQDAVVNQWMMNMAYLIDQAKQEQGQGQGAHLTVSADFPFWINQIMLPGQPHTTLSSWMLGRLDSLTLMAFRDSAGGPNGIISHVTGLVDEAAEHGKKIVVGVNLLKSDEGNSTTFYEEGAAEMNRQLNLIVETLGGRPGFSGTAVHDYDQWQRAVTAMKEGK